MTFPHNLNFPPSLPTNGHIRAIFFDLDDTLRYDCPSSHHAFFDYAVELGALDLPENRRLALRWAHAYWANTDNLAQQDFEQFDGHTTEFWQNYARQYLLAYGCFQEHAQTLARRFTPA